MNYKEKYPIRSQLRLKRDPEKVGLSVAIAVVVIGIPFVFACLSFCPENVAVAQNQQSVTAVVVGPKEATAGDLVILDASRSSNATEFRWLLVNSTKTFYSSKNDPTTCIFSSADPGEYVFVLVAAGQDNNGKLDIATEEFRLVLKGNTPVPPNPNPPGPNPPNPNPPNPNPPNPPQPDPRKVTRVIVVMDTNSDSQTETEKLLALRTGKHSDRVLIIDKQQAPNKYKPEGEGEHHYPAFFGEDKDGNIVVRGHISKIDPVLEQK